MHPFVSHSDLNYSPQRSQSFAPSKKSPPLARKSTITKNNHGFDEYIHRTSGIPQLQINHSPRRYPEEGRSPTRSRHNSPTRSYTSSNHGYSPKHGHHFSPRYDQTELLGSPHSSPRSTISTGRKLKVAAGSTLSAIRMHNSAANTIQSGFRKKKWKEMQVDRAIIHRRIAYDLLQELMLEYIQEEFLPDILIDVFLADEEDLQVTYYVNLC